MGDKVKPRRDWIESNVRFNGTEEGDNILEKVDETDPIDSKIVDDLLNKE
jgi:Type IIA topoisomerase (DNA gyrase/topo II, topoisomerase IV), B subunit